MGGIMVPAKTKSVGGEAIAEVRKEAIQQTAKWLVGAFVLLMILAATGWWLFFEPKIKEYINQVAGGVPSGTVIATLKTCTELGEQWAAFTEGKGRMLVGAGTEAHSGYATWEMQLPEGGVSPTALTNYAVGEDGGEESHILTISQLPPHSHDFVGTAYELGGWGSVSQGKPGVGDPLGYGTYTPSGTITRTGEGLAHNSMPPFIAVNFCKKV